MSDKRRRRRRASGGSSEEDDGESLSGSDHEYESAAEDSAQEESEVLDLPTDEEKPDKNEEKEDSGKVLNVSDEHGEEVLDLPSDEDKDWEDDEGLTEERAPGDGQEENKKVDDDEDRRNPQYIPKKGMFYEHDDRIDSGDEGTEGMKSDEIKPLRKPRSENVERWGHDKFLEREQQPKTRDELVNTYGYDIRNEDSAPRARRRRRYGRGPNKYTRNWEDEEAYEPKSGPKIVDKQREYTTRVEHPKSAPKESDLDEFPPLDNSNSSHRNHSKTVVDSDRPREAKPTRGGGGMTASRGRGGRGRGRGGIVNTPSPFEKKTRPAKSEYSANQRLQKEPKPPIQNVGKMDKLEKDFAKTRLDDNKKRVAKDSPRSNRKIQDGDDNSKPKRYSSTRRGGGGGTGSGTGSNSRHQQEFFEYNEQDSPQQQQPSRYMNGNTSTPTASTVPSNFVNTFPNSGSGPPPAAPFIANTVATPPTSTSGFLDPAAIVNYGPPVQFAPVAVPVTVNVPLVSVPGPGTAHNTLPVLAPPLGTPTVTTPDQVLLAAAAQAQAAQAQAVQAQVQAQAQAAQVQVAQAQAAQAQAAQAQGQGYAEVRGGVTYFNATAQQVPVMARPVNKRPKAAIPIVDPSQAASMSPQSSTDGMDDHQHLEQSMMVANT